MPPPSGVKVELQLAGAWTDVTADFDYTIGWSIRLGRTGPADTPQVSTLNLTLRNPIGKYTPGLQVLSTGALNPMYPALGDGTNVRVSTAAGVRWSGAVQTFTPTLVNGVLGAVQIVGVDDMARLGRVDLLSNMRQEIVADQPLGWWPLGDASDSLSAASAIGDRPLTLFAPSAAGAPFVFGGDGPGVAEGSAVTFAPTAAAVGQLLQGLPRAGSASTSWTAEMWLNPGLVLPSWGASTGIAVGLLDPVGVEVAIGVTPAGAGFVQVAAVSVAGSSSLLDGGWHHLAVTADGGAGTVTVYVDAVAVGTASSGGSVVPLAQVTVGDFGDTTVFAPARYLGRVAQLAVYPSTLSPARVLAHFRSGMAWYGETVDQRIGRLLSYVGVTTPTLDASTVVLNTYDQTGKDVLAAIGDAVASEGGGAVFYVLAGQATFRGRGFRGPSLSASLTVDMRADAADAAEFALDTSNIVNTVTVSRAAGSGQLDQVTVQNAASVAAKGVTGGQDATTYETTWAGAQRLAQSIIARAGTAALRMSQLALDLLSATHNLYADLQSVEIGSRLRATSVPAQASPTSQVDGFAEGWTEQVTSSSYIVTFDTSPADNPPVFVFDTSLWQTNGTSTLSVGVSATDTTVVVATAGTDPTFTVFPPAYPLTIQVGAEHILLPSPPSGTSSPQTFTGVTRGVDGTSAAAQAAGELVDLAPASTWAL